MTRRLPPLLRDALLLLLLCMGLTWPLWSDGARVFSERLFVDGVNTAWHYDHVARRLLAGELPQDLAGFDWPCPRDRLTAPNWVDGLVTAPLSWLLPWPWQHGAHMAFILFLHGLGGAALARTLGARAGWPVAAGILCMLTAPLWHELQSGRLNGAWSGPALLAVVAFVAAARGRDHPQPLALRAVLAALLGAFTLAAWPLYAAMLLPAGLVLLLPALRRGRGRGAVAVGLAAAGGLLLAAPTLAAMVDFEQTFYRSHNPCLEGLVYCTVEEGVATVRSLTRLLPPGDGAFLDHTSAAAGVWLLLPAAALAARRGPALALAAWGVVLVGLSLGPCATVELLPTARNAAHPAPDAWADLWCYLGRVNRPERFATPGLALVFAAGAAGLHQLARRGPAARLAAGGIALLAVGHSAWLTLAATWSPDAYRPYRATPAMELLADAGDAVAATLPFDGKGQYLAALEAPDLQRINPFEVERHALSRQPAIAWLQGVGAGLPERPAPTDAELAAAGIDLVLFVPARCPTAPVPGARCLEDIPDQLVARLGPPDRTLADQSMVWQLDPAEGARAAREAACGTDGTDGRVEGALVPVQRSPAGRPSRTDPGLD